MAAGADALVVRTDSEDTPEGLKDLFTVCQAVRVPVLRRDWMIHPLQASGAAFKALWAEAAHRGISCLVAYTVSCKCQACASMWHSLRQTSFFLARLSYNPARGIVHTTSRQYPPCHNRPQIAEAKEAGAAGVLGVIHQVRPNGDLDFICTYDRARRLLACNIKRSANIFTAKLLLSGVQLLRWLSIKSRTGIIMNRQAAATLDNRSTAAAQR